jgi:secondary thiamine-phosphate synthase enzyme
VSFRLMHQTLTLKTTQNFEIVDITPHLQSWIEQEKIQAGQAMCIGQHTTTALVINEHEERLWQDIQTFLEKMVPSDLPYLHNDLHLRTVPEDEPINAHAHLMALVLGTSIALPIHQGRLALGTYQSVLMVELDGPRSRSIVCQIIGG